MFTQTLKILQSGTGNIFPCAAVAIGLGHKVYLREFLGHRQVQPQLLKITENTLFDLASLSKLVSTSLVALKFIENNKLMPEDSIKKYLNYTGNYSNCNILHLMTHTSGLQSYLPLYSMHHKSGDALRTILNSEPCSVIGEEVHYSCMGYIVLQRILETIGGETLDKLAEKYVFSPLGMTSSCYNPQLVTKFSNEMSFAATEFNPHTCEWATGNVHDENANFLGGISGNAGVFATLDDMIAFAGMCSTRGLTPKGKVYISRQLFDYAIQNHTPGKEESRGLGFQLKGEQPAPMGTLMAPGSYGHTGFTGTSLYVDKETGLWGILLTNTIHYGRDNRNKFFPLRKCFYDTMITEFKELKQKGIL